MNLSTLLSRLTMATLLAASFTFQAEAQVQINYASDVFLGGQEGPTGTPNYRIPGMNVAPDGSLLAFIESRGGGGDAGRAGEINLAMKRSIDGGRTWGAHTVLGTTPGVDYSNPVGLTDSITGNVFVFYNKWADLCGEGCVSPGNDPNPAAGNSTLWYQSSSDNGVTWATEVQVFKPNSGLGDDDDWRTASMGPGSGMQLQWQTNPAKNGRLIVQGNRSLEGGGTVATADPFILYSDDNGANWTFGAVGSGSAGNENEVAELTNGDLLINARPSGGNQRRNYISTDGGETMSSAVNGDPSPITTVDASMIRYSAVQSGDDRDRLVFSGPSGNPVGSGSGRNNLAVWTSYDEGATFINPVRLDSGHAGYSVAQKLQNGTIGVLYEETGNTYLRYVNVNISTLEGATHDANMSHFDGFGNAIDANRGGVGWSGSWATNGNVSQELGGLEFTNMAVANDVHGMRFAAGGDMTRDLGTSPIDLDADQEYFVSLFIRSNDDGTSGGPEFFDINLKDGDTTQIAFGSGSNENFALNMNGVSAVSAGNNTVTTGTTYFLLAKIVSSSSSNDEVSLVWYDNANALPADAGSVVWGLTRDADLSGLLDTIELAGGNNAIWNVDALRIGTTFDSVVFTEGTVPEILGDLNADGLINLDDWIVFKANFGDDTSGLTFPEQEDLGDLDVSGSIDLHDFVIFTDQYDLFNGAGAFAGLGTAVPEPSSLLLLTIAGLGQTFWKSSRATFKKSRQSNKGH